MGCIGFLPMVTTLLPERWLDPSGRQMAEAASRHCFGAEGRIVAGTLASPAHRQARVSCVTAWTRAARMTAAMWQHLIHVACVPITRRSNSSAFGGHLSDGEKKRSLPDVGRRRLRVKMKFERMVLMGRNCSRHCEMLLAGRAERETACRNINALPDAPHMPSNPDNRPRTGELLSCDMNRKSKSTFGMPLRLGTINDSLSAVFIISQPECGVDKYAYHPIATAGI